MQPAAKTYSQSPAPHIHDSETVAGIYFKWVLACFPLVVAALIGFGFEYFRTLGGLLFAGLSSEFTWCFFLKKKNQIKNGHSIYLITILSLLLPPALPWWQIAIGGVSTVILFRELPGGLGSYPVHPAAATLILFYGLFQIFKTPVFFQAGNFWLDDGAPFFGACSLLAIGFSALIILGFKLVSFEIPSLYLLGWAAAAFDWKENISWMNFFPSAALISAFFLMADASVLPMKKKHRKLAALTAGVLSGCWSQNGSHLAGLWAALIAVSAFSAWFEIESVPKKILKK